MGVRVDTIERLAKPKPSFAHTVRVTTSVLHKTLIQIFTTGISPWICHSCFIAQVHCKQLSMAATIRETIPEATKTKMQVSLRDAGSSLYLFQQLITFLSFLQGRRSMNFR